jgi:hypothetical protein
MFGQKYIPVLVFFDILGSAGPGTAYFYTARMCSGTETNIILAFGTPHFQFPQASHPREIDRKLGSKSDRELD